MDPDDLGSFGVPPGVLLAGGVAILAALFFFFPQHISPPPPPPSVLGCYSARGGPNILVDHRKLRVLQAVPIEMGYKLEYRKGWALSIDRWLNFVVGANGSIKVVLGSDFGQFLFISREGEVASREPGFYLIDRDSGLSIHYHWTGAACHS